MLYTIFIYQSRTGLLMYDKNFQDISSGKMELFGSFFSAIKSFMSELVLEGSKELKNIEMGDYTVVVSSNAELGVDVVMIADKQDYKTVNKILPKVIKLLIKDKELFSNWDGDREPFRLLDQPLTEIILSKKKLLGEQSLVENPELVLRSMWAHKRDLSLEEKQGLVKEKEFLIERRKETQNLLVKQAITQKLVELSEKLKDDREFIKYQREIKQIKDQVKDLKLKLNYYLEAIKTKISETVEHLGGKTLRSGDYKDTYLNLYSFSTKLKTLSINSEWEKFRDIAKTLIDKDDHSDEELSDAISKVLNMSDNLDDYIDELN